MLAVLTGIAVAFGCTEGGDPTATTLLYPARYKATEAVITENGGAKRRFDIIAHGGKFELHLEDGGHYFWYIFAPYHIQYTQNGRYVVHGSKLILKHAEGMDTINYKVRGEALLLSRPSYTFNFGVRENPRPATMSARMVPRP